MKSVEEVAAIAAALCDIPLRHGIELFRSGPASIARSKHWQRE